MRKTVILIFIFLVYSSSSNSQNYKVEDKLMNCIYNSFEDGGLEYKKAFSDYEEFLIEENAIENKSGKSYINLLEKISNNFIFNPKNYRLLNADLGSLSNSNPKFIKSCQKEIIEKNKENLVVIKNLQIKMSEAIDSKNFSFSEFAKELSTVFSEDDLNHNFYKLMLINVLEAFGLDSGLARKLSDKDEISQVDSFNLEKSIEVSIDADNRIFIDKKQISIEELKPIIKQYECENKSESFIVLKNNRKTLYKKYIEVQEAIVSQIKLLREELAIKNFKKNLKELSTEELKKIKEIYPINLREFSED